MLKRVTKRPAPRVGRGGKRGKTSGRGHKGQKAHAAHAPRPEMRDTIKKLPKQRGFGKNRSRTLNSGKKRPLTVSLASIEKAFASGDVVSPATLVQKGVVSVRKGDVSAIKILANGELKKKVVIENCLLSESAKKMIEKAGGEVKVNKE